MSGQIFGRGVDAFELRQFVEIVVVERRQRCLEHVVGAGDIDDDAVRVEFVGEKRHRMTKVAPCTLARTENLPAKGMGDHDLVGDFNRVHENSSSCVFIGAG
jgi:hypothetical protein